MGEKNLRLEKASPSLSSRSSLFLCESINFKFYCISNASDGLLTSRTEHSLSLKHGDYFKRYDYEANELSSHKTLENPLAEVLSLVLRQNR